jgi:2-amino-4-hydroxy-6-hydroxymethyldihydropteridine diphosphokinase
MKPSVPCAIALGSNLGDSRTTLETALELLEQAAGITLQARSHWYETQAVGPPQPDYLNGCALLDVTLSPHDLLHVLLQLETRLGRVRRERWGPRTLDLDLLLFGNQILDCPTLQIPHPHLHERAFVLVPLAEIAPQWIHPLLGLSITDLLQQVDTSGVKGLDPLLATGTLNEARPDKN